MLAYEELKGSSGRQIFFRPKRYATAELFADTPPKIIAAGKEFKLFNLSLTGACITANQHTEFDGAEADIIPFDVRQAGFSLLESRAKIVRCDRHPFGVKLAVQFVDGAVDFAALLNKNAQARIASQLDVMGANTFQTVSKDYRAHCAAVLHFLRSYRAAIESSQQSLSPKGSGISPQSAYEMCEQHIIPQWRKLWLAGNELIVDVMNDKTQLEATKEFTELVLTPEFNHGAVWWRSYYKPSGYPGDFEIMNYVYDWKQEGKDAYSQVIHRVGLDVSECIATRMHVVRREIANTINTSPHDGVAKILSLGCGSAREVELHLKDANTKDSPVLFTLIDQEQNALAYAYEKTHALTLHQKQKAKVQALNVSFTDVLRGGKWLDDLGPQDLIYSVGLIDYLVDKRARSLCERLYEHLSPGGLLIIGNMNETSLSNLWPMEFITDWHLFYRNEADMLAWSQNMIGGKAWTEVETTGRVRLLFVRKTV